MRKIGKRLSVLLLAFACLATLLFSVPVCAAEETSAEDLSTQVESFLSELLGYTDEELQQVVDYYGTGGFYEVAMQTIQDNREELGEYHKVNSVECEESDGEWICTADVEYDNYNAEVVLTLDESMSPTNMVINPDYPLGVKMAQAGQNTLVGLLIVFVVLLFLAFLISLFKFVNPDYRKEKKLAKAKAAQGAAAPAPAPAPAAAPAPAPAAPAPAAKAAPAASDNGEIVAVIAAAIAAAEADSTLRGDSYVVTSIKRVGTSRRWKRA